MLRRVFAPVAAARSLLSPPTPSVLRPLSTSTLAPNQATMDAAALAAAEIIPDVLPAGSADGIAPLDAKWEHMAATPLALPPGFHPLGTAAAPKVSCAATEAGKYYTVIITDPDAPSRAAPAFREFHHCSVVNAAGGSDDLLSAGDVANAYIGPGPPFNSGAHRYVVLVYLQKDGAKDDALLEAAKTTFGGRGGTKAHAWATKHSMQLVAAGAWEASWDASVDAVHEAIEFMPPPEYQSPAQQAANAAGAGSGASS